MSKHALKALERFVENPFLGLAVGLILLFSGISEALQELETIEKVRLGVHHGVIVFALLQIVKALPNCFAGLEYIKDVGKDSGE